MGLEEVIEDELGFNETSEFAQSLRPGEKFCENERKFKCEGGRERISGPGKISKSTLISSLG